ncbi:HD domain-containing protein [Brevibacillus sp. MER 51]|uniref:HD domain-containing protein n=1 Tax=Brevibacillus sp. MER 51 TaxID=2939560 RepID=UPI002040D718|nr:HD domain-containing protein [Brevibacillus sp. MER 51]MCM3144942.1 HD domain-containing protein [Brevibacillus sp. MER 51]
MQMVTTTMVDSQKLWMVVKRMEPHLIRNQANIEKLLKMLMIQDVSNDDNKELWSEFESNETYEAKVAHAIIRLSNQIEI